MPRHIGHRPKKLNKFARAKAAKRIARRAATADAAPQQSQERDRG